MRQRTATAAMPPEERWRCLLCPRPTWITADGDALVDFYKHWQATHAGRPPAAELTRRRG